MKDDLNASEKRLIAALDRINRCIDRASAARADGGAAGAGDLSAARAENQRLSQELVALHAHQAEMLAACETRLAEAHQRLVAAGQEAARLSAANEALAAANRTLIEAAPPLADDIRQALEAEIASLHAARAAEIAQVGDILTALDRMVDAPDAAPAPENAAPGSAGQVGEPVALDEERG